MARGQYADVLLSNARLLTLRPLALGRPFSRAGESKGGPRIPGGTTPQTGWVAVKDGVILAVGAREGPAQFKGPHTLEIDCQGMALAPGFVDAHCHLMGLASSLVSVDCRPGKARSISQIVEAIRTQAQRTPLGQLVSAFGYDEFYLSEKRHPTRWELDAAAPSHPVRLDHRTGHASVLSSRALDLLNISKETADPVDGVIQRDGASGEPTGVLYEMGGHIRGLKDYHQHEERFLEGMRKANELLLSRGITSVQDASPGNDVQRWHTFRNLKENRLLTPRVTMMIGASHLDSFLRMDHAPGSGDSSLKLGAVKVMLTLSTGALQPQREELMQIVIASHRRGFQLAFHAVEEEAVEAVADALIVAQSDLPGPALRHRIEHCSECPPRLLDKLKRSGALVVTQPSFIYHNGERYLSQVDKWVLQYLYPLGLLSEGGITLAAGSDAPVTDPDPLLSLWSAVTRTTSGGSVLALMQAVSVETALRMHSIEAAYASFDEKRTGSIEVGKLADLVLLDKDPTGVEQDEIRDIRVMMTMADGQVVWQR